MFDYLQKFNNLPKSLRDKVSSPEAMRTISSLEEIYKIDLAAIVMKIMTKVLTFDGLVDFFINNSSLSKEEALSLKNDLLNKTFFSLKDYLGINSEENSNVSDFVSALIKETGISLASEDLYRRLKNIILTYQKGVRNKMDTKNSLTKEVQFGGLNLSEADAENILLAIKSKGEAKGGDIKEKFAVPEVAPKVLVKEEVLEPIETSSRDKLDKIIMSAEASNATFYNLKNSVANQKPQLEEKELAPMLKEEKMPFLLANDKKEEVKLLKKEEVKLLEEVVVPINLPIEKTIPLKEEKSEEKVLDLNKEIEEDLANIKLENQAKIEKEIVEKKESEKKVIKVEEKEFVPSKTLNLNLNRPASISPNFSKIRINDIKPVTKIISPIDELRLLDLVNFRRLGSNPKEIVLKVFSKIKLLEKDGYDKMITGVKAWRQSEVNHLYIKIGQEVMMKNSSFLDIIQQREKAKLPFLSSEEINAISQLNSKLSF